MKLVDKCLEKFLIPFFRADCMRKWGNKCRIVCTFFSAMNMQLLALFESWLSGVSTLDKLDKNLRTATLEQLENQKKQAQKYLGKLDKKERYL
jgi:hypothetical protein